MLWITPLRALASDTLEAIREPIADLQVDWNVVLRTADASPRDRRLARLGRAGALVTTPESLALLLSYPETAEHFQGLQGIVVDEWHELLGTKRGVLLQLGLAQLRSYCRTRPRLWGLSATIGNLEQARAALFPRQPRAVVVRSRARPSLVIDTLLPVSGQRFPFAGHLGLSQLEQVVQALHPARSALLFTNTRAQAELWFAALQSVWPHAPHTLALHHGSLDASLRHEVEQGLRAGRIRCVVATSSLDLGVDFPHVERVAQLGSPKGVARLVQRAGRAQHRPGGRSHIVCVPTHVLEIAEYAAARAAVRRGWVEDRPALRLPLDVLAQHCVSVALATGFCPEALFRRVRQTHAFAGLRRAQWREVLEFIVRGGAALEAYPEFRRVTIDAAGIYRMQNKAAAFRHRLSIGTIVSDGGMQVRFLRGATLGSVDELFIARLKPGDRFQFAGKHLQLVRLHDMAAYVRVAKGPAGAVSRWPGGRMALSSMLGKQVGKWLARPESGPELRAMRRLLDLQERVSALPQPGATLVESLRTRAGWHLFVYPFLGRDVHEGLAALLALRWGRQVPNTINFAVNDYGLLLTFKRPVPIDAAQLRRFFSARALAADLAASLNLAELAKRRFREVARVAGLLPPSLPGRVPRSLRQLQASSALIYETLQRFDPGHLLLRQAREEVLEVQLNHASIRDALRALRQSNTVLRHPCTLTPLSFPLWAEGIRGHLSTEDWRERVQRAQTELEERYAG